MTNSPTGDVRTVIFEFEQLVIFEIERSSAPVWVKDDLKWILRICLRDGLPSLFKLNALNGLLGTKSLETATVHVIIATEVVPEPPTNITTIVENFLRRGGPLQEKVIEFRAQLTDIPRHAVDWIAIDHPHKRAVDLAICCTEYRFVFIESITKALIAWSAARFSPNREHRSRKQRSSVEEQRQEILRKYITRPRDFADKAKVAAAFNELDAAQIPLPNKRAGKEGQRGRSRPREGTWTGLLRSRSWRKTLGPTLLRSLYDRSDPDDSPASVREPPEA